MVNKSKAKASALADYEIRNMEFMKSEFDKRKNALDEDIKQNETRKALYEKVKKQVNNARNSTERNKNKTSRERNATLKKKYKNINAALHTAAVWEQAMHVNPNTGNVTTYQPVSFVNIVWRKATVDEFNSKKDFAKTPEATIHRKSDTKRPVEWRESDPPITKKEHITCGISTNLLNGSIGKWKVDDKFLKEGSGVIFKVIEGKLLIRGVFKEYPPNMIAANPELRFCSERYWKENKILYAEEGVWEPPIDM